MDVEEDKFVVFTEEQKELLEKIAIGNINSNIKKIDFHDQECNYPEKIDISCPLFKENNFILSKQSIEKCNKVYHYMKYQVPCILEGETGTSKS